MILKNYGCDLMGKNTLKKYNSSFVITVVFIIIVLVLLIVNFKSLISSNELRNKIEIYQSVIEDLKYENEKLKYELEKELDEDEIRKIAKEELDRVDPDEEHYVVG